MLNIAGEDIANLNDADLRTLIGRLAAAEVQRQGHSSVHVTFGGHQDASDGGTDVWVDLPGGSPVSGFVPKAVTIYQTKKSPMPAAKITKEMRPNGKLRPAIADLANRSGAYVIVSSGESNSAPKLQQRVAAMKKAAGDEITVDFYDRDRVANWAREHPGIALWAKQRIGKGLTGWYGYGAWATPLAISKNDQYLSDDSVRIHKDHSGSGVSALQGIGELRRELSVPGASVRLVGLSGVGKTRLVEALFNRAIGTASIDPSWACYTDLGFGPNPTPVAMAESLIATGKRMVLIVDNCGSQLHQQLTKVCQREGSQLSVLTIEYDVREDLPESTTVFRLEASSIDLIEKLIQTRLRELSPVTTRAIAEISGGNARIALLLASTMKKGETIAEIKDAEFINRLLFQGEQPDETARTEAEVLSLVYSFDGVDATDEPPGELCRLGRLIERSGQQMHFRAATLLNRGVVQKRSSWRAVLPHALANRLASRALKIVPIALIREHLLSHDRMLSSFSRRLSYLHDSAEARQIVADWFSATGMLSKPEDLNELGFTVFSNVAPVDPEQTLRALEAAFSRSNGSEVKDRLGHFDDIIRKIAYDAKLFERAVALLIRLAKQASPHSTHDHDSDALLSLFFPALSGTHASIEQRMNVVEHLLKSGDPAERSLGAKALKNILEVTSITSFAGFEFGAHQRDFGYRPSKPTEYRHWFGSALTIARALACTSLPASDAVRRVLATQLRGLWSVSRLFDEVEHTCLELSKVKCWPEGWIAKRSRRPFALRLEVFRRLTGRCSSS